MLKGFQKGHTIWKGRHHTAESIAKIKIAQDKKIPKECIVCKSIFKAERFRFDKRKVCSKKCQYLSKKGKLVQPIGWKHSKENIEKIRLAHLGKPHILTVESKKSFSEKMSGENNVRWIKDRNSVVKRDHNSTKEFVYTQWRTKVFLRDNFKCKIADNNCKGKLQAHHILNWVDFPELRYDINNGIALYHAHHPRGRAKEKRLSPYFMELVSVSKDSNF